MVTKKIESKSLIKHISCKSMPKLNDKGCDLKQIWNNDK